MNVSCGFSILWPDSRRKPPFPGHRMDACGVSFILWQKGIGLSMAG